MDDKNERPGIFDLWPSVIAIHCPKCGAHWYEPRIFCEEASFPGSLPQAFCPRCGELLPTIEALAEMDGAIRRSPVRGKPFVGTLSGIRDFLERSRGARTQLWRYDVSHSKLILKIDSTTPGTHAFVVCQMVDTLVLPKLHWESSFALESTESPRLWALRDTAAKVEVVCAAVGIFYDVTRLW